MPRIHSITLNAARADQLHQLALEEYRSVQQQASYLLDRAIAQAIRERVLVLAEDEYQHVSEAAYAPTPAE
jgi:hypothetical protein